MSIILKIARSLRLVSDEATIVVCGLDNSGKSSILNRLKTANKPTAFEATPTVGYQEETFRNNNIKFAAFDMSGQSRYRNLWESYLGDADAILFVVDSSDRLRVVVAKEELDNLIAHPDFKANPEIPILIFANKIDVDGALSSDECSRALELDRITDHPIHIVSSNGVTGLGLPDGMTWLCNELKPALRRKSRRRKK